MVDHFLDEEDPLEDEEGGYGEYLNQRSAQ